MKFGDYILFYGTLRHGSEKNNELDIGKYMDFIGTCHLFGKLYEVANYPAVPFLSVAIDEQERKHAKVECDVFRINDIEIRGILDDYENVGRPNETLTYTPTQICEYLPANIEETIPVFDRDVASWTYLFSGDYRDGKIISNGIWPHSNK